jgi:hypothetical protein
MDGFLHSMNLAGYVSTTDVTGHADHPERHTVKSEPEVGVHARCHHSAEGIFILNLKKLACPVHVLDGLHQHRDRAFHDPVNDRLGPAAWEIEGNELAGYASLFCDLVKACEWVPVENPKGSEHDFAFACFTRQ